MTDVSLAATGVAEADHGEAPASPCEPDLRPKRRRWPDSRKARIASESFVPGASANAVAMRHGVDASTLRHWRGQALRGELRPCQGSRQCPPWCPLSLTRTPPPPRHPRRSRFQMPAAIRRSGAGLSPRRCGPSRRASRQAALSARWRGVTAWHGHRSPNGAPWRGGQARARSGGCGNGDRNAPGRRGRAQGPAH